MIGVGSAVVCGHVCIVSNVRGGTQTPGVADSVPLGVAESIQFFFPNNSPLFHIGLIHVY